MAKTPTTITTTGGKKVSGYIEGGKTYYSSGKRIGEGDKVTVSSGKEYVMKGGVGVPTGVDYSISRNQGAYRAPTNTVEYKKPKITTAEDAYAKLERERLAAQRQAIEAATGKLQAQKGTIGSEYEQLQRQAYVQGRLGEQGLGEQLAQMGYTGGATESARLQQQAGVQQSLSNIALQKQQALQGIDTSIADVRAKGDVTLADLAYQQQADALARAKQAQMQEKEDVLSTLGAYSSDYQARINQLTNDNDTSNDWQIPYLQAARQQKLASMASQQAEDEETAYKRALDQQKLELAYAKLNKSSGSSGSSSTSFTNKTDAYNSEYANVMQGNISPQTIQQNSDALIRQYGASKYNQLLELAKNSYKPNVYTSDFRIIGGEAR